MHLACVAEFLARCTCRGRLLELAKTRSGVGKSPTGQLDLEPVERPVDDLALSISSHVVAGLRFKS
jgi:hypothetical protein